MKNFKILGTGSNLPKNTVKFGEDTRYRGNEDETQLKMAVEAARSALDASKLDISEIDLIISCAAVGVQPIPCTAALIHEQIAKGTSIPAMDINTTCTSFITALNIAGNFIKTGDYKKILIVASEKASLALLEKHKEIYELFSDGAVAYVIGETKKKTQGIITAKQCTWSEGAHSTEIVGGLTGLNATLLNDENYDDYFFKMEGLEILRTCTKKLPKMFEEFMTENSLNINDIDLVIPHQASRALPIIMRKLKVPKEKYIDRVKDYGNQVSVSVPFMLKLALDERIIKEGDKVLLCGTAAGLTSNILLMEV